MKIGNFEIKDPIVLAPMAGVTDVGFRSVCSSFGADATFTEMLSARAMMHNPQKTALMTLSTKDEKIKIAQIFGHEEDFMAGAVQHPLLETFDGFDINMGCPAPKIIKNGEGCALMDNISLAGKIIYSVKKSTNKPVSVKFRKGNKKENYLDFAQMCEDCGADFVIFHPRTVVQGYSGHSDWEALAKVKSKLKIPVVGSGDVVDELSLKNIRQCGVDGVMVGRGSLGKPWLFAELKNQKVDFKKIDVVRKHISILREHFEENWLKKYIRKHLLWYASGLPISASVRFQLATCEDIDEALKILQDTYEKYGE